MSKTFVVGMVLGTAQLAFAYGQWLNWTPTGGVEIGGPGSVDCATLDKRIDAIEAATLNAPYIVTRAKEGRLLRPSRYESHVPRLEIGDGAGTEGTR